MVNYVEYGISRKRKGKSAKTYHCYSEAGLKYFKHIQESNYSAIVFDFDQTIHNKHIVTKVENNIRQFLRHLLENGIIIGIATGNGTYITKTLRDYFDKEYYDKVVVGYYNGGIICSLDKTIESTFSDLDIPLDFKLVKSFYEKQIPKDYIHEEGLYCEQNPYELNFYPTGKNNSDYYFNQLKLFILNNTNLKIMESPHSIDVLPPWISKLDVCKYLDFLGIKQSNILTMGDYGAESQSDYELLCRDHSLSVNNVSAAYNSCWNFAPKGMLELDATWFYLQHISISSGSFTIFNNCT